MDDFKDIPPPDQPATMPTAAQYQSGPPIAPLTRIMGYDPAEWEGFIHEWVAASLKSKYRTVLRFSGANDRGIDVAGFVEDKLLKGLWDNYQCKHFDHAIMPSEAWPEIGKILWHSFNGHYTAPRAYYFVAPRGTGTTLTQYLANTPKLKEACLAAWDKNIANAITSSQTVALTSKFAAYVDAFDFSIFKPISPRKIIEQHQTTPYFVGRFGGGLPARPVAAVPPDEIHDGESIYVGQLLAAYADHKNMAIPDLAALKPFRPLQDHFNRQRECFYHAESFRVFVRDHVEPGTFESLQEELFHGVVDVCGETHEDGVACVNAVTMTAQNVPLHSHPLGASTFVRDRRGICHQLANKDRLKWTK
jgi:hypothetical protein